MIIYYIFKTQNYKKNYIVVRFFIKKVAIEMRFINVALYLWF